jgi:hypothetical protein
VPQRRGKRFAGRHLVRFAAPVKLARMAFSPRLV